MTGTGTSETVNPEPEHGELNGRFSNAARQRIKEYLNNFSSFEPVLVLLYGNADNETEGSWSLQAVSHAMVNDLAHRYAGFGAVVCYDLDGFQVVVPQLAHINKLNSGVLKFIGDRLVPDDHETAAAG